MGAFELDRLLPLWPEPEPAENRDSDGPEVDEAAILTPLLMESLSAGAGQEAVMSISTSFPVSVVASDVRRISPIDSASWASDGKLFSAIFPPKLLLVLWVVFCCFSCRNLGLDGELMLWLRLLLLLFVLPDADDAVMLFKKVITLRRLLSTLDCC